MCCILLWELHVHIHVYVHNVSHVSDVNMLCYVLYLPLSLWDNNIGGEGTIAVSEALKKCGNLQHLKWVSATCMCVCLLKMVLVTSYICKGDGSIEEVGQSKLGVAYDGTCTNIMHKKLCSQCTWVSEIVQLRQRKSSKPALKICLVLTKWSGHGHPSPPTSSSPDMYIHTNTNVLKYVRQIQAYKLLRHFFKVICS